MNKQSDYDCAATIHPLSDVQARNIGRNTRVWQYVVILRGATIGDDCNICSHCFIENDVVIGNRVTVKCGVRIWDGVTIEDDVFIGPNATFTNDKFPRSKDYKEPAKTLVKRNSSIGANATILSHIEIGENAMVAAGAVVTKDVSPGTVVAGNPAEVMREIEH